MKVLDLSKCSRIIRELSNTPIFPVSISDIKKTVLNYVNWIRLRYLRSGFVILGYIFIWIRYLETFRLSRLDY